MINCKNIFGSGILMEEQDLIGKLYVTCTACMSIYSEFLSWANCNTDRLTRSPDKADSIVVLSCQVTDLAILNDIQHIERLMHNYPGKNYYVGGCLARRFDIDIPAQRLSNIKSDYHLIKDKTLVNYEAPFWIKDFSEGKGDGNLFRDMYPLRIGAGCKGKCKYCTIRVTRGDPYELPAHRLRDEFLQNHDVVLISDNPSQDQIEQWCAMAMAHKKPISIRNLEPTNAINSFWHLLRLARNGLLKILHVPIQSPNKDVLMSMGRDVQATISYLDASILLRSHGVCLATNIIVSYKDHPDTDIAELEKIFDHVDWNPYWDGLWDRGVAEDKFKHYFA